MELIATSGSGWDYYLNSQIVWNRDNICPIKFNLLLSNYVYAICNEQGKNNGQKDCHFGSIEHFKRVVLNSPDSYCLTDLGKKILNGFIPNKEKYESIKTKKKEVTWDEARNDRRFSIPYGEKTL